MNRRAQLGEGLQARSWDAGGRQAKPELDTDQAVLANVRSEGSDGTRRPVRDRPVGQSMQQIEALATVGRERRSRHRCRNSRSCSANVQARIAARFRKHRRSRSDVDGGPTLTGVLDEQPGQRLSAIGRLEEGCREAEPRDRHAESSLAFGVEASESRPVPSELPGGPATGERLETHFRRLMFPPRRVPFGCELVLPLT